MTPVEPWWVKVIGGALAWLVCLAGIVGVLWLLALGAGMFAGGFVRAFRWAAGL